MSRAADEEDVLNWVIRLGDPGFDDWEALTAWLAGSPDRARVFNALQLKEVVVLEGLRQEGDEASSQAAVLFPDAGKPRPMGLRRIAFPALALGLAGAAILVIQGTGVLSGPEWREVRTADGAREDIRLPDGTGVMLNGGTIVKIAPGGRQAELVSGEALFDVHHDAARPFVVTAGTAKITDLGTRFDVSAEPGRVMVAVAEGSVGFEVPDGNREDLVAGQGAEFVGNTLRRFPVRTTSVAGWREGTLHYEGAPVSRVRADVARATGVHIRDAVGGGSASLERFFTGTIQLDGSPAALRARLEGLLRAPDPAVEGGSKSHDARD
jgi:transmembrane sensor